jgi:hypothetical protein
VSHIGKDGSHGSRAASQFVGNNLHWFGALAMPKFSKEPLCRALITMRLDQDGDHVA